MMSKGAFPSNQLQVFSRAGRRAAPVRAGLSIALLSAVISGVCWPQDAPRRDRYGDPLPEGAVARCGTIRMLPRFGVWSVAISPDGKTVASASMPGSTPSEVVELWDAETGTRIAELLRGALNTIALSWSPDGTRLAVSHDNRVEILDVQGRRSLG
ncbi:MAG: hypothetical protein NUV77_24515, partial [Thermoguttaceae bacterium]|nr:hypothetical protein [Thermoguttaceae bacterium]